MAECALDPIHARFWSKVAVPDDKSLCWNWTASTNYGYGVIGISAKRTIAAHRLTYLWFNGPWREGMDIHHTCENRLCVNPQHLQQVTRKAHIAMSPNMRKAAQRNVALAKAASIKSWEAATDCRQCGLPYERRRTTGVRFCRPCWNAGQRRRRAARVAMRDSVQ